MLDLKVTDLKGNKPPLDSYLRRYLVGSVDLFPYIVPGLLGWIVAARNEQHQRLGDLSADTIVVDATSQQTEAAPTADSPTELVSDTGGTGIMVSARSSDPTPPPPVITDLTTMVDVEEALASSTPTSTGEGDYPVLDLEETADAAATSGDEDAGETLTSVFVESLEKHEARISAETSETELPTTSHAAEWHFPEAQEAPVWTPEPSTGGGPKAAAAEPAASTPERSSPPGEPVWNEQWSAWLFWDADGKRWLRHDPSTGWTPIEDSQNA
jgi:hypothetical protein